MKFDFTKHWSISFFGHYDFKPFYEYNSDKKSIKKYIETLECKSIDVNGDEEILDQPHQAFIEFYTDSIISSLNIVTNQMIVFLFTSYESMIEDFAKCLFVSKPNYILRLIHEIPEYRDSLNFNLTDFLKSDSKESYVQDLSCRLAKSILSNTPEKVTKRIGKIVSIKIDKTDLINLNKLMDMRNRIVHEGFKYDLSFEELDKYYSSLELFLKELAYALLEEGIKVIDEAGMLDGDRL